MDLKWIKLLELKVTVHGKFPEAPEVLLSYLVFKSKKK